IVNSGKAPIIEMNVSELIEEAVASGRLRGTTSAAEAVVATDLSLVCVGTPSRKNGSLDTSAVERVCEEIGAAIAAKGRPHTVVIRSTILPGTMRGTVIPAFARALAARLPDPLRLANNPELDRKSVV